MNNTRSFKTRDCRTTGKANISTLTVTVAALLALIFGIVMAPALRSVGASAMRWTGLVQHDHSQNPQPAASGEYYTCGMHPWVILPQPGDCPICHMSLVPVDPAKLAGELSIDPIVVQNMGVRVRPVVEGPLVKTIRTVGTIEYDESRVRDVNTKISGWIEKVNVDSVGQRVVQGDALFQVYSPELYAAQQEYLAAVRAGGRMAESARTRLEYFDVSAQQITALGQRGNPEKNITINSPHTGVVIDKHANEGMKIDPGMRLYRIADLSRVWVIVTVYEYQLPYVQQGQTAIMSLPYIPGQTFEGTVEYIYPYLNENTREAKVRLAFDNQSGLLKPGMFANVQLRNTLARQRTLAPRSAVIDTGRRQVALVSLGQGRFEPREVRLGLQTDDNMVQVLEGLSPGEQVVISGQFLLDSEAKMRDALARLVRGDMAGDQQNQPQAADTATLNAMSPELADALQAILENYLKIADTLASDTTAGTSHAAAALAEKLVALPQIPMPGATHFWHEHDHPRRAATASTALANADDLEIARLAMADLSIALEGLFKATGVPAQVDTQVQTLHCPMYLEGQGGSIWLQKAGSVRNPYYGSTMLACYDQRTALPVTPTGATTQPSTAPSPPQTLPAQSDTSATPAVGPLIDTYLNIHQALAGDDLAAALAPLPELAQFATTLADSAPSLATVAHTIASAATAAQSASDLEQLRQHFAPLSQAMFDLLAQQPPDAAPTGGLYKAYCSMVDKPWLQVGTEIANPYAPYMLRCGSLEHRFESLANQTQGGGQ